MIFKKKVWLIMDKKRGIIGSGVPRNRELKLISDETGTSRILTYVSKGRAEAGFKGSWFFSGEGVREYWKEKYGSYYDYKLRKQFGPEEQTLVEAVEAEIIIKTDEDLK